LTWLIDRAVDYRERFTVERRGKPAVVMLSVRNFIETFSPAPAWLENAWQRARQRGLHTLGPEEIDKEIETYRNEQSSVSSFAID
jgi:hypothetical protein